MHWVTCSLININTHTWSLAYLEHQMCINAHQKLVPNKNKEMKLSICDLFHSHRQQLDWYTVGSGLLVEFVGDKKSIE